MWVFNFFFFFFARKQCLDFSLGYEQIYIFVWHLWFKIQILVPKLANLGDLVKFYRIPPI